MKNSLLSISLSGVVLLSWVALSVPTSAQTGDSLQIQKLSLSAQHPLTTSPGTSNRIIVNVSYVLSSADHASLTLYAEEFPDSPQGCLGNVHKTDGAGQYAIQRGAGTAQIAVLWPSTFVPAYATGYITLGANFSTSDGSREIHDFGLFTKICAHFTPQVSVAPPGSTGQSMPILRWQGASNGSVPPGAIIGGYSSVRSQPGSTSPSYGTPYYVCRVQFSGSIFPGKIVGNNCNFTARTKTEIVAANYEVLTNQSPEYALVWRQSGTRPVNAIVGGRSGGNLYLCSLPYQGGTHSGWASPEPNGQYFCHIGLAGKEIIMPGFSYLVPVKGQPID